MIDPVDHVLLQDGVELARHRHRVTCAVEAVDRGLAVSDRQGIHLVNGVTIETRPRRIEAITTKRI